MFTGIIQSTGEVASIESMGADWQVGIAAGASLCKGLKLGDSIAVNGICLTVADRLSERSGFYSDLSVETLATTTAQYWRAGTAVNLEPALRLESPLGGHLVSGHIDAVAEVLERQSRGRSDWLLLKAPPSLQPYIVPKGSICIDGVSLTINAVEGSQFELMIVPHTAAETLVSDYKQGTLVNLEVDQIARYLEHLLRQR